MNTIVTKSTRRRDTPTPGLRPAHRLADSPAAADPPAAPGPHAPGLKVGDARPDAPVATRARPAPSADTMGAFRAAMPHYAWGAVLTLYRYWPPLGPDIPALATVLAEWHDTRGPRWASCLLHYDPIGSMWVLWNPRYFDYLLNALGDLRDRK